MQTANLIDGFVRSVERFGSRPAVKVEDRTLTYESLAGRVAALAATIEREDAAGTSAVAVLGSRNETSYAAVLAALLAGKTYVPLHPEFPRRRTATMLNLSGAGIIVAEYAALDVLRAILAETTSSQAILVPDADDLPDWINELPAHRFCGARDLEKVTALAPKPPAEHAYLLFTSGSTGTPKGVPISHGNVRAYVDYVGDLYGICESDRLSQTYDLTFDLSVHDMFLSWGGGACLHTVPANAVMAPARFIRDEGLTVWFSVPSTVGRLLDLRMLKPGAFPSLRVSLFCGEPLPQEYAEAWQAAAPASIVENLYGPTEATIAITRYRWHEGSMQECRNGIVPIGSAFPGQRTRLIDAERRAVKAPGEGELCLAGSQVTSGYMNAPDKNESQFVQLPDDPETLWYRTGDLVFEGEDGTLNYVARIDDQVKIRGYRVELSEIEFSLRKATAGAMAVAVPWPIRRGAADGVVAFIRSSEAIDVRALLEHCRRDLPAYMVPRSIRVVAELPLNANGKIDRRQLASRLESEAAKP